MLPPEFAHLTALRQLSISHIGRGFPHLPASLHTLRMDVVSANANGSESDYVSPAGSLPNLRHLVDLRSLDLSSFEASKGFKLLPTTLTALHIGLAPEEDVYEYTCAADVSAAVLPKALTRLANLQDLKVPGRGRAGMHERESDGWHARSNILAHHCPVQVSGSPISEGFEYLPPTLTSLAYEEAHGRVPRALRSMIALRRLSLGMGLDNLPPNLIDMS